VTSPQKPVAAVVTIPINRPYSLGSDPPPACLLLPARRSILMSLADPGQPMAALPTFPSKALESLHGRSHALGGKTRISPTSSMRAYARAETIYQYASGFAPKDAGELRIWAIDVSNVRAVRLAKHLPIARRMPPMTDL
jgi:hypothetical protein